MQKCIYIIGPTSSGKSDLAITLAKDCDGEIIGCDSRQIYRHMDIGTGKEPGKIQIFGNRPTATKKAYVSSDISHYLIDSHHPNTDFSAGKFVARAKRIITDIQARDKVPIICGGTMFWAQSLLEGNTIASAKPSPELRKKLKHKSAKQLLSILKQRDIRRANQIITNNEINNKVRLIRSIEIATELGSVPQPIKADYKNINQNNLIIAIEPPKEILQERIQRRLNKRIKSGMLDEVYDLHHSHKVSWTRLKAFGLEYKWCALFLCGEISEKEFSQNLLKESLQYAKRQTTWIRRWKRAGATIHQMKNIAQTKTLVKKFLSTTPM